MILLIASQIFDLIEKGNLSVFKDEDDEENENILINDTDNQLQ